MIVILCPSYRDSINAFEMFETYLWEEIPPWSVLITDRNALLIKTDDDLSYLFIHHRFRFLFDEEKHDLVEMKEFFENLESIYYEHYM